MRFHRSGPSSIAPQESRASRLDARGLRGRKPDSWSDRASRNSWPSNRSLAPGVNARYASVSTRCASGDVSEGRLIQDLPEAAVEDRGHLVDLPGGGDERGA